MKQPTIDYSPDSLDSFCLTLTNHSMQPLSPNEDSNGPVRYDHNTSDSFYEIDIADFNMTLYPDQTFKDLLGDLPALEPYSTLSSNSDDLNYLTDILTEGTEVLHSTESNDIADPIQSTDEQLAMIKTSDRTLPVIRSQIEKLPTKNLNDQSISLSQSVAVTVPTPNQLQLSHPLEDTFRARYKSDYFPQKGLPRRPRYIADNDGNHFITLQMPTQYNRDLKYEYIHIALITTSINDRGHFYSPYKFQTNHNDVKVPDQNPMYLPVLQYLDNDSTMKLHLVLIKSKLDQLNHAQPLKPFPDTFGNIQNIINEDKLSPKDLINRYQLDKSHIAFTLCTKLSNGTYDIHPETKIISSVITELPTKPSATSNKKTEASTTNTGEKISCPNCKHCFDITDGDTKKKGTKRKSNNNSSCTSSKSSTNGRMNKKKK